MLTTRDSSLRELSTTCLRPSGGFVRALLEDFIAALDSILATRRSVLQQARTQPSPKPSSVTGFTLWGGAVDTQHALPFGRSDDVPEEVPERVGIFGPGGGGFVFMTLTFNRLFRSRTPSRCTKWCAKWLGNGAHICVKGAPTTFGKVDFDLSRSGSTLAFDHNLVSVQGQPRPNQILLHIPASVGQEIRSVRLNGKVHLLVPGQRVLPISPRSTCPPKNDRA